MHQLLASAVGDMVSLELPVTMFKLLQRPDRDVWIHTTRAMWKFLSPDEFAGTSKIHGELRGGMPP